MARRSLEIGCAVALAQDRGLSVGMVTLTMRHNRTQQLAFLWDALAKAWQRVVSGKGWTSDKTRAGYEGYLRAVEITHGSNGWHVHIHALVFIERPEQLENLASGMWRRWSSGLVNAGLEDPLRIGQDWHLVEGPADDELSKYLAKSVDNGESIGMELTSTQTKHARTNFGTRPWWSLLADVVELGDADALRLWHEWEQASRGRRQLTWSQGLRKQLGLNAEQDDESIASEETGTNADDLLYLSKSDWYDVVKQPQLIPQILRVTERKGLQGLRLLLDQHHISYQLEPGEPVHTVTLPPLSKLEKPWHERLEDRTAAFARIRSKT